MDYTKIGNFITEQRKAKNFTQAKLGEQLFVSEKTVSKWENGNGLPDTSILPKLCEILGITVNELLNGEKLSANEYTTKADEKLLELQKVKEHSDKRLLTAEIFFSVLCLIASFTNIILGAYIIKTTNNYVIPIILFVIALIVIMGACCFSLYIEQKAGYYECAKCGHKYVPKYSQVFLAMHVNRTRFMKCPKCGERSWQKKVIK